MSEIPFRSGKHFQAVHLGKSAAPGLIAAAVDIAYLSAILQFGAEEWKALLWGVLFATIVLTPLGQLAARRMDRVIARVPPGSFAER